MILLIGISISACNNDSFVESDLFTISKTNQFNKSILTNEIETQSLQNFEPVNPLPTCLDKTVVDTFIYYANEFTNYLWTEDNMPVLLDSVELINLATNANIASLDEFYYFVSTTFNVPVEVVQGFSIYSAKILPQLVRESEQNHPIASRYYNLIKYDCLISIFPDEMFEGDELSVLIRAKCGFWNLFASCAGLAASAAGAVMVETWTVGVGTVVAVGLVSSAYSYGSAIADCL